jgi:hypothetical protein
VPRALLVALLLITASARADEEQKPSYRAVVDRVELEPASITGYRLRVFLSALALDGQQLDLTDPKSIRLYVGTAEKKVPYALGAYGATASDTAVVVLVQATQDFADALPTIAEALDRELLGKLGDRAQVAVIAFGETTGAAKLAPAKNLRGKLALQSDGSVGDPALLDGIDRALIVLRKASAPAQEGAPVRALRKLVIVIGDGRDRSGDHERVTAAGKRAAKEGVRIHAIAYSPADVRRPLLVLGELAKRSLGTFRWPGRGRKPTGDSWSDAFKQLETEIDHQYVVTYFVNAEDDVAGKKLHVITVGRTEATSNEVKVPDAPTCGGAACDGYCSDDRCVTASAAGGRGVLGWLLLVAGIGLGAVVLLGLVGFIIQKAQQPRVQLPPGVQAPPPKPKKQKGPVVVPPGMLPNGRPIPALLVVNGPRTGERLLLRNGFMIGKQPGCDLLIEDGYTSSQHAQIGMDMEGNCVLYDRGSTNGTFINGNRVTQQPLVHGVTVRIGSIELRFLAQ